MEKIDKLQQLMKLLQNDTITPQEVEKFLVMVVDAVKKAKDNFEQISQETLADVADTLRYIESEHEKIVAKAENIVESASSTFETRLQEVKQLVDNLTMIEPKNGVDGKDADEEYIIAEVLSRIELPEQKEFEYDTGEDIVEKINQLPIDEKFQIDASHIKNLPTIGRNVGSQARNLFQLQDVTLSNPANNDVLKYNSTTGQWENGTGGGGGTPGGSNTQLQYNNAGAFGGITGATTDGTVVTLTSPIFATSQTNSYATASTIGIFDASKNLISADTATYPSLTELSYIKGVTSAIQTQLNGKAATLSGTNNEIAYFNGSSTIASLSTGTYPSLTELSYVKGVTSAIQTQINALANGMIYKGNWDASAGTFPGAGVAQTGWFYTVSVAGTVDSVVFEIGDRLIATTNNASTTVYAGNWTKLDATDAVTSVFGRVGNVVAANGDYTASQITNVPAGNIAATTVQAALNELDTDKQATGNYITALTGDVTASGPGSVAATLATVNSNVGSFGSATAAAVFTVNAKGLITAASSSTITPAVGSITGLGTNISTFLSTPSSANLAAAVTDETGSGALVFGTSPTITNPTLVTPSTFTTGGDIILAENTSIVLDPALSADGKYTGITRSGTAGTALAFGDLCYLDPTDSRWELADANSAQGADGDARGVLGICVQPAAGDGSATTMLLYGTVRADTAFPAMTVNNQIYVSETAGDVTGTQPTTSSVVIRVVGVALTADELLFNPSPDYITHV